MLYPFQALKQVLKHIACIFYACFEFSRKVKKKSTKVDTKKTILSCQYCAKNIVLNLATAVFGLLLLLQNA